MLQLQSADQNVGIGGLGLGFKTGHKKTPAQGRRKVIEAGFIQARNLSSSDVFIRITPPVAKLKV
jgi:hypothetical protein